jgi:hypothetical protein
MGDNLPYLPLGKQAVSRTTGNFFAWVRIASGVLPGHRSIDAEGHTFRINASMAGKHAGGDAYPGRNRGTFQ